MNMQRDTMWWWWRCEFFWYWRKPYHVNDCYVGVVGIDCGFEIFKCNIGNSDILMHLKIFLLFEKELREGSMRLNVGEVHWNKFTW